MSKEEKVSKFIAAAKLYDSVLEQTRQINGDLSRPNEELCEARKALALLRAELKENMPEWQRSAVVIEDSKRVIVVEDNAAEHCGVSVKVLKAHVYPG